MDIFYERERLPEHSEGVSFLFYILANALKSIARFFVPCFRINFHGVSTQTPQGRLPPALQEWGIRPNLVPLGIRLYATSSREYALL